MIFAGFRAQSQVRANERGPEFRNQFLNRICRIAESLSKLPVAAFGPCGPMRVLVRQRRIIRDVLNERGEWGHLNVIRTGSVIRAVPSVVHVSADGLEPSFGAFDPFGQCYSGFRFRRVSVHLRGVEHGNHHG